MAGIGDLFSGFVDTYQKGIALNTQRQAVEQQQKRIDIDQQEATLKLKLFQRQIEDMQTLNEAMGANATDASNDAKAYQILDQAHQFAALDPKLRASQLDVFAAGFEQATGQKLAPNVVALFKSAPPEQLTAIINKATVGMLNNPQADLNSLLSTLTNPLEAAGMVTQLGGEVSAEATRPDLTPPQTTAVGRQIAVMNNSRTLLQRQADRLQAALGKVQSPEVFNSLLKQWETLQTRITTIDGKVADLSKPVTLARGGAMVDPLTNEVQVERSSLKSPAEVQQEVDIATRKAQATTEARQKALQNSGGILTPEDASFQADMFLTTGQMPGTGMGTVGQINRVAIIKEARRLAADRGQGGKAVALGIMERKTTQQAIGQLKKNQAAVTAFEKTALANAEQVRLLSAKVDRTGAPVINRWLLAGRAAIAGDVEVAKFNLAVRTFINEYARVTTSVTGGGVTSDTARREMEASINNAQTADQIEGVITQAIVEMKNRIEAYDTQLSVMRSDLAAESGAAETPPAGTAGAPPASAAPAGEAAAPESYAKLPPPAQTKGKVLVDSVTGRRLRSDGVRYHPVQ